FRQLPEPPTPGAVRLFVFVRPVHPEHPFVDLKRVDLVRDRETMRLVEHRNRVADLEVLVVVNDAVGARLPRVVNEVVRVEASPAVAELSDPWPHVLRPCLDSDRPCRVELRSGDNPVSWH